MILLLPFFSGNVENCVAGNGAGNYENITLRRIEMTGCGGTAECMYFGQNDASYYASGFLVENTYCHDTNPAVGTQGSKAGIQFKSKSYNSIRTPPTPFQPFPSY
jgi:hypothetical protein